MTTLYLSRMAAADLERIGDYIAVGNPAAAEAFVRDMVAKCELLASSPGIGRDRSDIRPNTRSFPVGHYVVFFQVVPDGIEVLRILHGARDVRSL